MTLYAIHAPPMAADGQPDPEKVIFVKEGFSWPALFFAEIWLMVHGLWVVLLLYLVIGVALTLATAALGGPPVAIALLYRLLFAFEANGLGLRRLERRGYQLIDVVEGRRLTEAELRYFAGWPSLSAQPDPTPAVSPHLTPTVRPRRTYSASVENGGVVGLFPLRGSSG